MAATDPWWKSAVLYQIYPRSFCDASGDGVGDLEGVRRHLDHLRELGVDGIWLSPFFRSPMKDYGYDVSDYCDVDPLFGSLDEFDRLLADAHARDLKVLIDWVPNHTSDEHPWFVDARSSRHGAKRDWYIWRDQPVNHWKAAFGGDAWTYDERTEQWYLHMFLAEQPELNWANPEVRAAMLDTLRFWLDRGVDGFRIDVIHGLGKDPELADTEADLAGIPHSAINDQPETHPYIREVRALLDSYDGDRVTVGEVYLLDTGLVAKYYGDDDELHLAFNFRPMFTEWDAAKWARQIERAENVIGPVGWPVWVLSNHDTPRHRTRFGGSEARARVAAVMLLTLRGTPFMYAGEELGLEDAVVPADRVVDPGGRDGCRAPVPWDASPAHGWATVDPWLPWPPEPSARAAATLRGDDGSILNLYRRLLAARRASDGLRLGSWTRLDAPETALAYERAAGDDRRVVVLNFGATAVSVPVLGDWQVEVDSADPSLDGTRYTGTLAPETAMVLRPAP
jgi:alpha-glucosidase